MTRRLWYRLTRLEKAIEQDEVAKKPIEPWPVMIPSHLAGTPEAKMQEDAFTKAHGGRVVLCQLVDARLKPESPCEA